MLSIILYMLIPMFTWGSFRKGFYDGILYGLIHQKAGRKIGAVKFQPYLYAGQAICRGWGLIGSPGIVFLLALIFIYTSGEAINQAKRDIANAYAIYLIGYSIILGYLYFGYQWIKEGYIDGIKNKKTKTYYHLQDGEKYFINSAKEKERTISKHKYFRGQKAVKTGIARVALGSAYILVALLLFMDREYYVGDSNKSIYPNAFEIGKEYYQKYYPKKEKQPLQKPPQPQNDNTVMSDELKRFKEQFEKTELKQKP